MSETKTPDYSHMVLRLRGAHSSRRALAMKLCISENSLEHIERSRNADPRVSWARRIEKLYAVYFDEGDD